MVSSGKKARRTRDADQLRCHQIVATNKGGAGTNKRSKRLKCHLCHLAYIHRRNKARTERNDRVSWGCRQCKVGFHVACFNAWHHPEALQEANPNMYEFVKEIKEARLSQNQNRWRQNQCLGDPFNTVAEEYMLSGETNVEET